MGINTKLLYDEDGFCRLCSERDQYHKDECPGLILHGLRYEVTYEGDNCSRGCCGSGHGSNTGDTLMEAVTATAQSVSGLVHYSVEARLVFELPENAHSMVKAEAKRLYEERKAAEAAKEARDTLKSYTDGFTRAVQALEAERGDLTPEAYARRMRELRDAYATKGVVFSDPVTVTVDDDPMTPCLPAPPRSSNSTPTPTSGWATGPCLRGKLVRRRGTNATARRNGSMSFNRAWGYLALASLGSVLCFAYVWHDLTHQHGEVLPEVPERVPVVMSLRRCSDIMEARRLMTDIQLRDRWPGGDTSPIVWEVRVMDVRTDPRGGNGLMVYFACPESQKLQMAGTFYTTAGAIGLDGGLDINRGDIITIRGNLHRNIEGWGASLSELYVYDTPTH